MQVFPRHRYLVSPDDQRFLMVAERGHEAASPITLLLNWVGRKDCVLRLSDSYPLAPSVREDRRIKAVARHYGHDDPNCAGSTRA